MVRRSLYVNLVVFVFAVGQHSHLGCCLIFSALCVVLQSVIAKATSLPIQNLKKSLTPKFQSELAKLPHAVASSIETWMSSVDAFMCLKQELGPTEYLPFVLQLKFLFDATLTDEKSGKMPTRKLCLSNVLQYILGNRSRPLSQPLLQKAYDILLSFDVKDMPAELSARQRNLVEACVFCHKSILIGDKTLTDTVQPQIKWTLKAAKKLTGCSCCAPEEEEEEAEGITSAKQNQTKTSRLDEAPEEPTARRGSNNNPKYVDGRTMFAFDPVAFSKPSRDGART